MEGCVKKNDAPNGSASSPRAKTMTAPDGPASRLVLEPVIHRAEDRPARRAPLAHTEHWLEEDRRDRARGPVPTRWSARADPTSLPLVPPAGAIAQQRAGASKRSTHPANLRVKGLRGHVRGLPCCRKPLSASQEDRERILGPGSSVQRCCSSPACKLGQDFSHRRPSAAPRSPLLPLAPSLPLSVSPSPLLTARSSTSARGRASGRGCRACRGLGLGPRDRVDAPGPSRAATAPSVRPRPGRCSCP